MEGLTTLLRGITSNHSDDYCCMNYLCSFRTESKLKLHENVCKNHNCCNMVLLEEDKNVLKYNKDKISSKTPFTIYVEIESLLKKVKPVITIQKNLPKQI